MVFDHGVAEGVELAGGEHFDVMLCVLLTVVVRWLLAMFLIGLILNRERFSFV